MDLRTTGLGRFLYSHYFFSGARQAIGMMLPAIVLGVGLGHFAQGLIASFGALCVAVIDQPGGPQRHRGNEMLGGAVLCTITVIITGLASTHPLLLWLAVIGQAFAYSMLNVYGPRGGLIGFGALLLMILTMRLPLVGEEVLQYALSTSCGALFYIGFSMTLRRVFGLREEMQTLAVALMSMSEYVAARAEFYDQGADLDACYRTLIQKQSLMTTQQQAARDLVLRALPRDRRGKRDWRRIMLWNIFVDMLTLNDALIASNTDYALLHRSLGGNDILLFMRDALVKMSRDLNRISDCVATGIAFTHRTSVKAEFRAIDYEIMQLRQNDIETKNPDVMPLIIQIQRRLRNAAHVVERLGEQTTRGHDIEPTSDLRIDSSLTRFISRDVYQPRLLTNNLRLNSPNFRYAVRVTLAIMLAMTLSSHVLSPNMAAYDYWILLTIIVIMKPGFALTRSRNAWRLFGTLIGCLLSLVLFKLTHSPMVLFFAMLLSAIIGYSLTQLNYMASAVLNTVFVVLSLHFVSPDSLSPHVAGERALDTLIGCALALVCSYVLPWWEYRYMPNLARNAIKANREYMQAGERLLETEQALRQAQVNGVTAVPNDKDTTAGTNWFSEVAAGAGSAATTAITTQTLATKGIAADAGATHAAAATKDAQTAGAATDATIKMAALTQAAQEADLGWRLARKNVHMAFSNFAEAFYRMMREPQSHQQFVPELNNLLIQSHMLASQTTATVETLHALGEAAPSIHAYLESLEATLDLDSPAPPLTPPTDLQGDSRELMYALKQMGRSATLIRRETDAVLASIQ